MVQVFTDVPPTHVYMCVCWLCYERVVESGCIWVEDKPENADLGVKLGLDSYLMSHPHNIDYVGSATCVNNWKEIYNKIVGE